MTEQPSPVKAPSDAHLASAEREWRGAVPDSCGDMQMPDLVSQWLMAEYDRRGECLKGRDLEQHALRNAVVQLSAQQVIVQAATALVEGWEPDTVQAEGNARLLHALGEAVRAAAVRGETP